MLVLYVIISVFNILKNFVFRICAVVHSFSTFYKILFCLTFGTVFVLSDSHVLPYLGHLVFRSVIHHAMGKFSIETVESLILFMCEIGAGYVNGKKLILSSVMSFLSLVHFVIWTSFLESPITFLINPHNYCPEDLKEALKSVFPEKRNVTYLDTFSFLDPTIYHVEAIVYPNNYEDLSPSPLPDLEIPGDTVSSFSELLEKSVLPNEEVNNNILDQELALLNMGMVVVVVSTVLLVGVGYFIRF